MLQRYEVTLERINVYVATITLEADDLADASQKAIARARAAPNHWEANVGPARVVKVIAHAKDKTHAD